MPGSSPVPPGLGCFADISVPPCLLKVQHSTSSNIDFEDMLYLRGKKKGKKCYVLFNNSTLFSSEHFAQIRLFTSGSFKVVSLVLPSRNLGLGSVWTHTQEGCDLARTTRTAFDFVVFTLPPQFLSCFTSPHKDYSCSLRIAVNDFAGVAVKPQAYI